MVSKLKVKMTEVWSYRICFVPLQSRFKYQQFFCGVRKALTRPQRWTWCLFFFFFFLCKCDVGGLMDDLNTQMAHRSDIRVCCNRNMTLLVTEGEKLISQRRTRIATISHPLSIELQCNMPRHKHKEKGFKPIICPSCQLVSICWSWSAFQPPSVWSLVNHPAA